tara:strand:+ start:1036 stop:1206 length:171 start_codon:yes stop_codon:yes gene_type:complete
MQILFLQQGLAQESLLIQIIEDFLQRELANLRFLESSNQEHGGHRTRLDSAYVMQG